MKEQNGFGNCEECGKKLQEYPNAAWGIGYVCRGCAYKLINKENRD